MTLEELCEVGYELASKILLKTKEQLMTSFTLAKADNSMDVIHCPWKNDQEKKETILTLGHTIISMKDEVLCYSMLTECWTSHYKHFNSPRRAKKPEFDPERQEGVLCWASDGQKHIVRVWAIGRDAQGRCTSLAAKEGGEFTSWMTDAIDGALRLQRAKFRIVNEFRATGDVDTTGLPAKVQEAIKNFIHESKPRSAEGNQGSN